MQIAKFPELKRLFHIVLLKKLSVDFRKHQTG